MDSIFKLFMLCVIFCQTLVENLKLTGTTNINFCHVRSNLKNLANTIFKIVISILNTYNYFLRKKSNVFSDNFSEIC